MSDVCPERREAPVQKWPPRWPPPNLADGEISPVDLSNVSRVCAEISRDPPGDSTHGGGDFCSS